MRPRVVFVLLLLVAVSRSAAAQDPPPPIPRFVVDLHGTAPQFSADDPILAASRGMQLAELPGMGIGLQVGVHIYPIRWKAITFGVGGELAVSRARQTPDETLKNVRAAEERFQSIAPQISFNFGTGNGWSYISGGMGQSTRALTPVGQEDYPGDTETLKTINYGGGARWFMKRHLAFSFDVRVYAINPGSSFFGFPQTPRTNLLVIGAGVSLK